MVITVLRTSDCPSQLEKNTSRQLIWFRTATWTDFYGFAPTFIWREKSQSQTRKAYQKGKTFLGQCHRKWRKPLVFICLPKSLFEFPAKQTANLSGHSAVFAQYLSWNLTMPTHLPKINVANLMYRKLLFGSLWCVWFQYSPNCKLGQWLWYALLALRFATLRIIRSDLLWKSWGQHDRPEKYLGQSSTVQWAQKIRFPHKHQLPKSNHRKKNTGNANLLSYVGQPSTYVEVSKIQILGKQTIKGHCRTHAHFSENQRWNWLLIESPKKISSHVPPGWQF